MLLADRKTQGSWISITRDGQGRLLLGGQRGQPVTRVTVTNGAVSRVETLRLAVSEIMGMTQVGRFLYADGSGPDGKYGLWRLSNSEGHDDLDQVHLVREWPLGGQEHGAHGVVEGPDHKLYVVSGDRVPAPSDAVAVSPFGDMRDDMALPRAEDPTGFCCGQPDGGFIARVDPDNGSAELVSAGQRNDYGIAFNGDGELFGFDSDMEWDWGTPWYRPTRFFHATWGTDMGYRDGSAKWPDYYPDTVPPVVNVGIGSPTGLVFGTGARFPARYQKAAFALDWSYGRVLAIHLTPRGASYSATFENFVAPSYPLRRSRDLPLNLTGVVVGADGALYLVTGGRDTAGALYRVAYEGTEPTTPADLHDPAGSEARALRRQLEALQPQRGPEALGLAWDHLGDADPFVRNAARVVVEGQPVAQWKDRALTEPAPQAALTALLALVRMGGADVLDAVFDRLLSFPFNTLSKPDRLTVLRICQIGISRYGRPSPGIEDALCRQLGAAYPSGDVEMNRELCQVLLALHAPDSVSKTVSLLSRAPTQEEQLTYIFALRGIRDGWTPSLRRAYFSWWGRDHLKAIPAEHSAEVLGWFKQVEHGYGNGPAFKGFVENSYAEALQSVPADERGQFSGIFKAASPDSKLPAGPPRPMVREWTMDDLAPDLSGVGKPRDLNNGRQIFLALCVTCHKLGDQGGAVGPELTGVASRYSRDYILESILLPSKVISSQYANTIVRTTDGDVFEGRVISASADKLVLRTSPTLPSDVGIQISHIRSRELSKVSPMPAGLVNTFTRSDILDLLAYLESAQPVLR